MEKNKLIPSAEKEHEEKVAEVTDMITAEDLLEQAVYAVNAPDCCSGGQQAENMLNMLGANVIDSSIYHTPDEHPTEEAIDLSQKL